MKIMTRQEALRRVQEAKMRMYYEYIGEGEGR